MNRIGVTGAVLAVVLVALAPVGADALLEEVVPAAGEAALAKYMPDDSTLVLSVNIGKLAETGLFEMVKGMGDGEGLAKLEELGINLEKDITQVMIGLIITAEADEPEAYLAIAGTLPKEKILAAYEEEMGEAAGTKTVAGQTVYEMDEAEICFLPGLLLVCPSDDGEADISKMLEAKAISADLAGLIKNVNTKGTLWLAASLSQALRDAIAEQEGEGTAEAGGLKFSALKSAVASFDYADTVALDATIGWTGEEPATQLLDMFNQQVKPLGEQIAETMPDLAKLLSALEMTASGTTTTVKLSMARADFDAAVKGLTQMIPGPGMAPPEEGTEEEGTESEDTEDEGGDEM
jgi:hypothetical protein